MTVSRTARDATEIIRIEGRFDFSAHRDFRDAVKASMENAKVTDIEIDLSAATYIDSAALGMLLLSLENAKAAGKRLVLARPTGAVKQVLDIANFQRLFEIR
jgi:anti-anti-sigma factor